MSDSTTGAVGPFFIGQVPVLPFIVNVRDSGTNESVDLSAYSTVTLVVVDPDGVVVDTSGGLVSATNRPGQIRYDWPSESLFTAVGDYSFQVRLRTGEDAIDITTIGTFEVRRGLPA